MNRTAMKELLAWKNSSTRKPLLLCGARQVGKTWLMKEFGLQHFQNVAYVNFDTSENMREAFAGNLEIPQLISILQIKCRCTIKAESTLIIFDEIQEAPRALTSLKYFYENAPEYAIIAAGSLLGVAMHPGTSFPVGKVDMLDLYPMSFTEFLNATGNEHLSEALSTEDWKITTAFKSNFIDMLKKYYVVGGMPEAVKSFVDDGDFEKVRRIHRNILDAYEQDFSKHAPAIHAPRIRLVWDSIPQQLAKENRKFLYSSLRESSRAKDFELAIQWLKDCGLITLVYRISKPDMPIAAYRDSAFKMFMVDIGLLGAKSGLDPQSVLDGNRLFKEFKGALTEQYVLQQLVTACNIKPCYWGAENSSGEVDFVFQHGMNVIPLEVKAEENLKAKSLQSYCRKYHPPFAVRCSMSDYREQPVAFEDYSYPLFNLPLYGISQLNHIGEIEN